MAFRSPGFNSSGRSSPGNMRSGGSPQLASFMNANKSPDNTSRSTSETKLDRNAKALSDKQFREALGLFGPLIAQTNQQYGTRLGNLRAAYDSAIATQRGLGDPARARIRRDFGNASNSIGQELAQRGMYNTSLQDVGRQAVQRQEQYALGDLEAGLAAQLQQMGTQRALATDQVMGERLQTLASLEQQRAAMRAQQASTLPTYSKSTSSSLGY